VQYTIHSNKLPLNIKNNNMDFFFDLFDSEKKRKAQLQQQQQNHEQIRTRTGSGGELPPLRRDRGYRTFSLRNSDKVLSRTRW
jgi:hypothetical protein